MGDLFYLMNDALPDLAFEEALVYLMSVLKEAEVKLTDKITKIIEESISRLTKCIQNVLWQPM